MKSYRTFFTAAFFIIFSSIVYLFVSGKFIWNLEKTNFAYFNLLAESFLFRRYDLIHPPANPFDLAIFKGAVYVPWGPLPAVVIMPIVFLFGTGVSDRVYTAIFGGINVGLFYLVITAFYQLLQRNHKHKQWLMTVLFAFGTVHFSVSTIGRVWFTSQIISLTFYLLSLLFLFMFMRLRKVWILFFSLGFFTLSIMGKLWYVLFIPMYFYAIWITLLNKKQYLFLVFSSLFIVAVFVRMYGLYNYRRFGSFFETGYSYQQEAGQFLNDRKTYGTYNLRYALRNIWYEVLNPFQLQNSFPFIRPDPIGNGLFFTTPFLLLLGLIPFIKKHNKLILFLVIGIVPYSVQLMFFLGTGFFQFGARYLLEIIPLLILMLSLIIPYCKRYVCYPLFILSILINSLGAIWLVINY